MSQTMSGKEFVAHVANIIEPLLKASEIQTQAYFRNNPDLDEAIFHFKRRMFNERMNIVEISKTLASMPASTDPVQLKLLAKQVLDEAKHYDMVKNVIEYLSGDKFSDEELNAEFAWQMDESNVKAKGASLFEEIGGHEDEMMAAVYQFVAEGRAGRVWNAMATSIADPVVSRTYAKIAKDETFHSTIGARTLEKLATTPEAQAKVLAVLPKMTERMYWINCMGTEATKEAASLVSEAYGHDVSDDKMAEMGKSWFAPKGELKDWTPTPRGAFATASNEIVDNFAS